MVTSKNENLSDPDQQFASDELPEVPDEMRKPPKVVKPKKPEFFDD